MAHEHPAQRYRSWYARLLRLYPKQYRDRFGKPMEQAFNDLLRERTDQKAGLLGFGLWILADTLVGCIRENAAVSVVQGKGVFRTARVTAFVLSLPLLAMLFTDEVDWGLADFVVASVMLLGAGFTYELIAKRSWSTSYRAAVGVAVAAALLLAWVSLAIGIIGSATYPANLMYIGVITVGVIGALLARFQPNGMAVALFATAGAQVTVGVVALVGGLGASGPIWPRDVLVATVFFSGLWIGSSLLFRRAGVSSPA